MGTHNAGTESKTGTLRNVQTTVTAAPITKSPNGTPVVVDLYNDQIPPGGG